MSQSHTTFAKFLHWGFVILYVYGIFKQVNELNELEEKKILLFEILFASIFLIIVIVRYSYMRSFKTFLGARGPVHVVHYYFARSIHRAMYACFILLPLSGLIIAGLYTQGYTVNATPDEQQTIMDVALDLHGAVADISYVLIFIHILAAIYSRVKGEGVWSSMVPIFNEEKPTNNQVIKKIAALEENIYDKVESVFSSNKK